MLTCPFMSLPHLQQEGGRWQMMPEVVPYNAQPPDEWTVPVQSPSPCVLPCHKQILKSGKREPAIVAHKLLCEFELTCSQKCFTCCAQLLVKLLQIRKDRQEVLRKLSREAVSNFRTIIPCSQHGLNSTVVCCANCVGDKVTALMVHHLQAFWRHCSAKETESERTFSTCGINFDFNPARRFCFMLDWRTAPPSKPRGWRRRFPPIGIKEVMVSYSGRALFW